MKGLFIMKNQNVRSLAVTAIMGAIGFILMMLEFPLSFIIPSFIKFDFSELPALITSFAIGPVWGVAVCLIKNLLHLFVGSTAGVGELSNFVLGAIFVFVAGIVYKRKKTRSSALAGTLAGAFSMAFISVLTNYFFVYPIYAKMLIPMDAIVGMYQAILPSVDGLLEAPLGEVLKRPYPRAVTGRIDSYNHDRVENTFTLNFTQEKNFEVPTEIFAHKPIESVETDGKYEIEKKFKRIV